MKIPYSHPSTIAPRGIWTPESEYEAVVGKKIVDAEWMKWVLGFHIDLWITPTFSTVATPEYAHRAADEYLKRVESSACGLFFYSAIQPQSCHLLVSCPPLWMRRYPPHDKAISTSGLRQVWRFQDRRRRRFLEKVREEWTYGDIQVTPYDARRGAVIYSFDHHEVVDFVGEGRLTRHRGRR